MDINRVTFIGQSTDGKGGVKDGYWNIREIKTMKDIDNKDFEVYDGPVKSVSYNQLLNKKAVLVKELAQIQAKLDVIEANFNK